MNPRSPKPAERHRRGLTPVVAYQAQALVAQSRSDVPTVTVESAAYRLAPPRRSASRLRYDDTPKMGIRL
jgi:hypothetical protein